MEGIDFLIMTALQKELSAVLRKLPESKPIVLDRQDPGIYFNSLLPVTLPDGETYSYRVVVACSVGMGRLQALSAINHAINMWRPSNILFVGIAGGVSERVKRGDVLVSTQVIDYEVLKSTEGQPEYHFEVLRPSPSLLAAIRNFKGDSWRDLIEYPELQSRELGIHFGSIASGDKLVKAGSTLQDLRENWPDLVAVEMEASGIACAFSQIAYQPGSLIIRSVADIADSAKAARWMDYACDIAASYAVAFLRSGLVAPEEGLPKHKRVELVLEGAISNFTLAQQEHLTSAIADILDVNPDQVRILKISQGSVVISIIVSEEVALRLLDLAAKEDPNLRLLGIDKVKSDSESSSENLVAQQKPLPTWPAQSASSLPPPSRSHPVPAAECGAGAKEQFDMPGLSPALTQPSEIITWLHLSDLHFREARVWDANIVLKALLSDVRERIQADGLRPDLILVSGDVAFSGKASEYALARRFFDQLLKATGLSKERLFVVPGNHDVERSLIDFQAEAICAACVDRQSINICLSSPKPLEAVMERFRRYAEFVNDYFAGHLKFSHEDYFWVRMLELAGRKVALLGLNSAWLSASDQDKDKLVLGERQARVALERAEGTDLKIALLHHPFDWLWEFDQNDSAALLTDNCHFILHGHLHRTAVDQMVSPDSGAMLIASGACYDTREYPNLYNFVRLDFVTGTGTIYLRRYSDARGGFWAKDTLTYKNVPEGVCQFRLPATLLQIATPLLRSPQIAVSKSIPASDSVVTQPTKRQSAALVPNPFGDTGRITDPSRFFDREELLRQIFEELSKGVNISLVGESQIGKSSLLTMVCALGPERLSLSKEAFVYLNLEVLDNENDFYAALCESLGIKECRGYQLARALHGKRYVLCLDEVEKMTWKGFTTRLRSQLRGLADGPAMPLKLVIASRSPLAHLFPDSSEQDSPLAGICRQLDVGPFPPDVARTLLAHRLRGAGITFAETHINALLAESGGHPARLQRSAADLYQHLLQQSASR